MLRLCLQRALRPVVQRLPAIGRHTAARCMGTRGRNEPKEPLNSPKRAKEFIYRLQPAERTCLLQELQSFESIAIAQGKTETSSGRKLRNYRLSGGGDAPATSRLYYRPVPSTYVGFRWLGVHLLSQQATHCVLSSGWGLPDTPTAGTLR